VAGRDSRRPAGSRRDGPGPDDGPSFGGELSAVDAKWEHCLTIVDSKGNITQTFPHMTTFSSARTSWRSIRYDPDKYVWIVDDHMHAIYKFTHDMKELVQTLGTPTVKGADGTHFNRPTFLVWRPTAPCTWPMDTTETRVAKFDKTGKFLMDWGMKGTPPNDKRPSYMNNVHGLAFYPQTKHVFVNDRGNHRIQVSTKTASTFMNGVLRGAVGRPSDLHRRRPNPLAFDRGTSKMLKYDLEDTSCTPGAPGRIPRAASGVCTDSASIRTAISMSPSRQRPRAKVHAACGANPAFMVSSQFMRHGNSAFAQGARLAEQATKNSSSNLKPQ